MRKIKLAPIAATTLALVATVAAAPASAVPPEDGTVVFVNGTRGPTLEVCVDDAETRSRLRYKRSAVRSVAPGPHQVQFRRAAPGTCNGKLVAKRTLLVEPGSDQTIVSSKGRKKTVLFRNDPLDLRIDVDTVGAVSVGHAAMAGPVIMGLELEEVLPPFGFVSDHPYAFRKGDHFIEVFIGAGAFQLGAHSVISGKRKGPGTTVVAGAGQIVEKYLVGDSGRFGWATVTRDFDLPEGPGLPGLP